MISIKQLLEAPLKIFISDSDLHNSIGRIITGHDMQDLEDVRKLPWLEIDIQNSSFYDSMTPEKGGKIMYYFCVFVNHH